MLTGFEALGAASAVLQVISFATDITVACKKAYDGATTSEDDLHRHAKQMSEAVDRVKSRCGQMTNTNDSFSSPELKTISEDCSNAARELEAQVSYVTSLQAKGDIGKAFRKAFRTFRRVTDVQNLVKNEHTTTRSAITKEMTRAEVAINTHTDSQVLGLRTTAETSRKCEVFLQSLKAPRMNQRYNDVMDSRDASFKQVFATYEEMINMYRGASEESGYSTDDDDSGDDDNPEDDANTSNNSHDSADVDSEGYESSEAVSYFSDLSDMDDIFLSWDSFNMWLQSNDRFFYIQATRFGEKYTGQIHPKSRPNQTVDPKMEP
ncbi:hypothetical protein FPRO03_11583 [Fusarium proliferatum]|nr:hypothetical protein FPRO03_11583 [Fusarium proliferatum]